MRRLDKYEIISIAVTFYLPLILYIFTVPSGVIIGDSGEFATAAVKLGIVHGPGYPLYVLISSLWVRLIPTGAVIWKMNLLSSLFASLACVVFYLLLRKLGMGNIVAVFASLILALAKTVWAQSIIADVYTLYLFLLLLTIFFAVEFSATKKNRHFYIFSLFYGTTLALHYPLLLITTPFFIVYLWKDIFQKKMIRPIIIGVVIITCCFLPYIFLYIRSQLPPPMNWGGRLTSFKNLVGHFLRRQYAGLDFGHRWSLASKWPHIKSLFYILIRQNGFAAVILGFWGMIYWLRKDKRFFFSILAGFFSVLYVVIYWSRVFVTSTAYDLETYFITSYPFFVMFVASGIYFVAVLVKKYRGKLLSVIVTVLLGLGVIATSFAANIRYNDRRNDAFADSWGRLLLQSLPGNAILFVTSDPDTYTTLYLHEVERVRSDVTIVDTFFEYLPPPPEYKGTDYDPQKIVNYFGDMIFKNKRRVFTFFPQRMPLPKDWKIGRHAYCYEIMRPDDPMTYTPTPEVIDFYRQIFTSDMSNDDNLTIITKQIMYELAGDYIK